MVVSEGSQECGCYVGGGKVRPRAQEGWASRKGSSHSLKTWRVQAICSACIHCHDKASERASGLELVEESKAVAALDDVSKRVLVAGR